MKKRNQSAASGVPGYELKCEGNCRPRISSEQLHRLWHAKQRTGKPITKLVEDAIDLYFENQKGGEQ
jgi:hypothetical protein